MLVVGEALVDVVHRADGTVDEHPGGSPANVALTLGRLGRAATLACRLGPDEHGAAVRDWLAESDVTLAPGSEGAERTSVAAATLDGTGAATYEFDITWDLEAGPLVHEGALAVHTGSIGAVLQPGGAAVLELVRGAREHATITYDPNARPSLMGRPEDVGPQIEELVRLADVVKVSDEDLEWLVPGRAPLDVAREWQRGGPALVVVTLGGDGAVAITGDGGTQRETTVDAPATTVVDTVGAGDSFMGALLDGLWTEGLLGAHRRDALRAVDPVRLGRVLAGCVQVAAVTVSRAGANPPRRAELAARG
nr:carbohydrate kinase [Cellulomonas sp. PhB143]